MKKFRFMMAFVMVVAMVFGMPLNAIAATWDVTDSAGVENAFLTDTDAEVIINMQNDINMDTSVTANEGQNYTINGNGNTISDVVIFGSGSVEIDADVTAEDNYYGLDVYDEASVTVTGDAENVWAGEEAEVNVEGNVSGNINATGNASVTVGGDAENMWAGGEAEVNVEGNVDGTVDAFESASVTVGGDAEHVWAAEEAEVNVEGNVDGGVDAYGSASVTVGGDVTSDGLYGSAVNASEEASVTVGGDVTAEGPGSTGVFAGGNSTVTVEGNVTGGSGELTEEEMQEPGAYSDGGTGVAVYEEASVSVGGDVTGGDAMGTYGWAGGGAVVNGEATLEVGGNITGGSVTADPDVEANYDEEYDTYSNSRAGNGLVASYSANVTVGGDVTGGSTNGDHGAGGNGIVLEAYYPNGEEDEPEQGSVTVAGTAEGGTGGVNGESGAGVYFGDDSGAMLEDTDLEGAMNADPAELTEDQMILLSIGLNYVMENELVTEEQLEELVANAESEEAVMAAVQALLQEKLDTSVSLLDMMGMETSKLTVGAVSGKNGPQYDSAVGSEEAAKHAEEHVTLTAVTPATGDGFDPMLVLAVALISLLGICVILTQRKKAV